MYHPRISEFAGLAKPKSNYRYPDSVLRPNPESFLAEHNVEQFSLAGRVLELQVRLSF
jgi:hypothetical protein